MATCGENLVKILENYGIDTVFGIPGVHTVELYRGLPETKIRHITPRHEQGAGYMADGYHRASGKLGVCFIITGPGMTNIMTAMGQAMQDSIPMLVISSVNRRHQLGMGEGALHELPNQSAMMEGVCAFSHTLMRPDELPKVLARAFSVFSSERPAPVHIEIPMDVITADADHIDLTPWPMISAPAPAPAYIVQAVKLLSEAKKPLIAIGGGAKDAAEELKILAEALDAPVMNTVNAKGVLPYSHPLAMGGSGSSGVVRKAFQEADVVLAIGTEFSETDYDFFFTGDIEASNVLIRMDIDAAQLTRNIKPDLAIVSDAQLGLSALNAGLADVSLPKKEGSLRAGSTKATLEKLRDKNYAKFFETIREALPEVIIAGDSAQPIYYAWLSYETEAPRRYFHSATGYGTLGYAIPAAIGAKLALPDAPVVGLIGDGAAQFTIGELSSAVEAGLPVIFLVWNNFGYGEIKRFMEDGDIATIGVDIHTPNYVMLAKGFGMEGVRVSNHAELKSELIAAHTRTGPSLIEVMEADFADGYPDMDDLI